MTPPVTSTPITSALERLGPQAINPHTWYLHGPGRLPRSSVITVITCYSCNYFLLSLFSHHSLTSRDTFAFFSLELGDPKALVRSKGGWGTSGFLPKALGEAHDLNSQPPLESSLGAGVKLES